MTTTANTADREILDLIERWSAAELHADVETLESMLDRDFMAVGPLGFVLNKTQWLDRHRSGELKYQEFSCQETAVRHYGELAIAITTQTQKAAYRGNPVPMGNLRATLIAVPQNGGRVIAGLQLSAIVQQPGRL